MRLSDVVSVASAFSYRTYDTNNTIVTIHHIFTLPASITPSIQASSDSRDSQGPSRAGTRDEGRRKPLVTRGRCGWTEFDSTTDISEWAMIAVRQSPMSGSPRVPPRCEVE